MDYVKIWERFFATLRENEDYQETVRLIAHLEPDFPAAQEPLSDLQREQIDRYLQACDAQTDSMVLHAYRLGYEQARREPFFDQLQRKVNCSLCVYS